MWKTLIVSAVVLTGCPECYSSYTRNYTAYTVTPDRTNPKYGYGIDDPAHTLNDTVIESIVGKTLACVKSLGQLTIPERDAAECVGGQELTIHSCMTVKVAPDWGYSCRVVNSQQAQVFPCAVPAASCLDKGLVPTVECPCSCRAIIQDNATIVTVPDVSTGVFSAQLITLWTGCVNPWPVPRLATCIFKE
jgi:hypothetical protein